jgi:Alginate lyase
VIVAMKFKLGSKGKEDMLERNSSIIPTTPLKKEDWSDRTSTTWQAHSSFLERTSVTGIRPPPRLDATTAGTNPLMAAARAANAQSGGSGSNLKRVLLLLALLPVVGAAVYFGALGGDPTNVLSIVGLGPAASVQVNDPAPPALKAIAKNPNKGKPEARDPAAATAQPTATGAQGPGAPSAAAAQSGSTDQSAAPAQAAASAPVQPASASEAATPAASTAAPVKGSSVPSAQPSQLPLKQPAQAPSAQKQESTEAKIARLEARLHPLIRLSTQPSTPQQKSAVSRDLALIALDREETKRLRANVARDKTLQELSRSWRAQALQPSTQFQGLATFKELDPSDDSSVAARIELQKIRELTMAAVVFGESELAKRLRSAIMTWAKTYKPLGDAVSDSEVEPVIEAAAILQATLPIDERGALDTWMHLIADRQISQLFEHEATNDLYFAKHLKTMALIGFTTGNKNIQNYVLTNFTSHIASAIIPDGSTTTYQSTHSVIKHAEHLQALLRVSVLLNRAHANERDTVPTTGGNLAKAIDFAYPYLLGKMEHVEYRGAKTSTELEMPLNPAAALGFLDTVLYFRSSMQSEVATMMGRPGLQAWDPASLYYTSMIRKTDDFENRVVIPNSFRQPAANVKVRSVPNKRR